MRVVTGFFAAVVFLCCSRCGGNEMSTDRLKNRLGEETSPYLLQHAENPVHWQPWDSLAFQAARDLDRPIFLSIGYSTCHWCHVMEEESFQDSAVAELMNRAFVCIKVDREERPDIDNVYMRYAMAMTGSGGWPLNVVMTPEGAPFFAATYIPRRTSMGRRGMMELVPLLSQAWKNRREEVVRSSREISSSVFQQTTSSGSPVDADLPGQCLDQLTASYDSVNGGFGRAPKFPSLHNVMFLLRAWKNRGSEEALTMAINTLAAIRYGGVYDQLAGGVHRYSTDSRWNVPHFEKMLYDQAMLIMASLEGYQAGGSGVCRQTARETADFLLREMRSPEGGFYSALDADTEEGEGAFYTWTPEEVRAVLSSEQMERFSEVWSLQGGAEGGRSVIRVPAPANWRNLPDSVPSPGEDVVQALLAERRTGPSPFMDRKIIAHWNGLAAAALARAYMVLGER
ncbi:MAG: DUF255 domain-containing protein, partial [Candidatus Aegiribacteria sp.]|nr:DUF255 domain-containing protein [Candidatus Aegiribacteria sp.]MBD3294474.1 DUF255 domain-containing protein [Candidatus Fermentibacteria bacterium]